MQIIEKKIFLILYCAHATIDILEEKKKKSADHKIFPLKQNKLSEICVYTEIK